MACCRLLRSYKSLSVAVFAISLGLSISSGRGGDAAVPTAEQGYALAQRFCTACHLIGDNAGATVPAGVPAFRSIANKPGQTGQRIIDFLIKPHPPMPDIQLSREEMLHIVAYLETLRNDKAGTPLLDLEQPNSKPVYPDHS